MVTPHAVANVSNLALGVFLGTLALFVWRRSPDRLARVPLAAFLALVGANYFFAGFIIFQDALGLSPVLTNYLAIFATLLDPPLLLAFAFVVASGPLSRLRKFLIAAPALFVAAVFVATPPVMPYMSMWPLRGLYLVEMAAYYTFAFWLLISAYVNERRSFQRDRLATLVVAFGLVVLPRLPLLLIDFGIEGDSEGFVPLWANLSMIAVLTGLFVITAVGMLAGSPVDSKPHAARTSRALGGLLVVVAAMWLLTNLPGLSQPAHALLFSFRWFLFAAVFSTGVRRYDLMGLSELALTRIRRAFTGALLIVAVAQLASLFLVLPGSTLLLATLGSIGVVGVAGVGFAAMQQALPKPPTDVAWRRSTVYRAHVELEAPREELEALRARLGLSVRGAQEIEESVRLEREAPGTTAEILEGQRFLGRYDVKQFLGAGAFGRTFLAWDRMTSDRVVLKELLPAWRNDPKALERFRAEADVALRVSHPNLVGFRDLQRIGSGHLLVLEYIEGETLRAALARGPLAPDAVVAMGVDILAGLTALHAAGVIHRDVKPDNIVIRPDGRAVLLDFGAATSATTGTRQAEGHTGTRAYMSPEQVRGDALDERTDIHALGVSLWEALTGSLPPRGAPIGSWKGILGRAIAADPKERYPNAAIFSAELAAVVPSDSHRVQR